METFEECIWLHLKGIEKELTELNNKRDDEAHPMPLETYNNLWYRLKGQEDILYRILSGHANPTNQFSPMFDEEKAHEILPITHPNKPKKKKK
jgi:hypothetical protein